MMNHIIIRNGCLTLKLQHRNRAQLIRMKQGLCRDHKNVAELICLNPECESRLMCLLCQHHHEMYTSIRAHAQADWKRFKKIVDQSIDRSLGIVDEIEKGGIESEKKLVVQYYTSIKQDISRFLDLRMNQNLALFTANSNQNLQFLIRSRIEGRYYELPDTQFLKIKAVYDGKNLEELAREEQQANLENVYNYMQQFHQQCQQLFMKFKIEFKIRVPEIRVKSNVGAHHLIHVESYDEEVSRDKQKPSIKFTTDQEIEMLVTDGYSGQKEVLTVGFDKTLRVFDKNLKSVCAHAFPNVLTRIEPIGGCVYAIGVSKQLHINKISCEDGYEPKQILILKGHSQRIWDISSFNSRIIGSCSEEGTKIWDLYKQRCEYTLRQQINPSCMRFMSAASMLAVGYHTHSIKIYSIATMKPSRSYELSGVPLFMSQENRNENLLYCGGFHSDLKLFDIRVSKQIFSHGFRSEAVTHFRESVFQEETLLVGERGGKVRMFDLRKLKTRLEWQGHPKTTNLSKPNGVVRIFEQGYNEILTIGSNDRRGIVWELRNEQ